MSWGDENSAKRAPQLSRLILPRRVAASSLADADCQEQIPQLLLLRLQGHVMPSSPYVTDPSDHLAFKSSTTWEPQHLAHCQQI